MINYIILYIYLLISIMNIDNFLPYEETLRFIEKTGFNLQSPYVFIKIVNDNGEDEIILTLANNIQSVNGEVLSPAYIYEDFIDFIKEKYNYDLYVVSTHEGYEWTIFKSEFGVTHKYTTNIKYTTRGAALNMMMQFFMDKQLY